MIPLSKNLMNSELNLYALRSFEEYVFSVIFQFIFMNSFNRRGEPCQRREWRQSLLASLVTTVDSGRPIVPRWSLAARSRLWESDVILCHLFFSTLVVPFCSGSTRGLFQSRLLSSAQKFISGVNRSDVFNPLLEDSGRLKMIHTQIHISSLGNMLDAC